MTTVIRTSFFLFGLLVYSFTVKADPWFTGALLAGSAETAGPGSAGLSITFQNANTPSIYNYAGDLTTVPLSMSNSIDFDLGYGLNSKMDIGLYLNYVQNQTVGISNSGIGDTALELGYQVITQGNSNYRPNFAITITQSFPIGRYTNLNPSDYATDATGNGAYQTSVGLNFDLLTHFKGTSHYLKASGSVTATLTSNAKLNRVSIYGGDIDTDGYINPGNDISLDLAAEYTLTQNWVAVIETNVLAQQASVCSGVLGSNPASFNAFTPGIAGEEFLLARRGFWIRPTRHNIFNAQNIGSGNMYLLELSPQIEYNFTGSFGCNAGVVVAMEGRNSAYYLNYMLEFVYGW